MTDATGRIIIGGSNADAPLTLQMASAAPSPPIVEKLFSEHHPIAVEKNKSIHSKHGVIYYPFWFGGVASAVSTCCTQPLGVG